MPRDFVKTVEQVTKLPGWERPTRFPGLSAGEQHVWLIDISRVPGESLVASFSNDERARAAAFRFDRHRQEFINCRGALRALLGRYLDVGPSTVNIDAGPNGKPYLAGGHRAALHFNVSHSGNWALIAISRTEIGVDIEQQDPKFIEPGTLRICLSDNERHTFEQLEGRDRLQAFFDTWTAKESYLKLSGDGLAVDPSLIDLNCSRGRLDSVTIGGKEIYFGRLPAIEDYSAAVAAYDHPASTRTFRFELDRSSNSSCPK